MGEQTSTNASWLPVASRLSFGVNAAHPFVQFFIEAHASLDIRIFTVFHWLTHLFGITFLSVVAASCAFVFVQRPWAITFNALFDCTVRLLSGRAVFGSLLQQ